VLDRQRRIAGPETYALVQSVSVRSSPGLLPARQPGRAALLRVRIEQHAAAADALSSHRTLQVIMVECSKT
jgi:hypothetical protein